MDDLVSRQKVLRCIKESRENIDWGQSEDGDAFLHYSAALYRAIASEECLPPAQPERETGEWINDGDPLTFTCIKCGYSVARYNNTNFCPNCGRSMNEKEKANAK